MAYGTRLDLSMQTLDGSVSAEQVLPAPLLSGSGPPDYSESTGLDSTDDWHDWLGHFLTSGGIQLGVEGNSDVVSTSSAAAQVADVRLTMTQLSPLISLSASSVRVDAAIDGSCCSGALTARANTAIDQGEMRCFLPGGSGLPADAEPNTEILDHAGMRIVLNEQTVTGDGHTGLKIAVNGIHVYFTDTLVTGVGQVNGDVVIGHTEAELACEQTCVSQPLGVCTGDCGGNNIVSVDELITCVNVGLGYQPMTSCEALDESGDHHATIEEIVKAVYNLLNGCPSTCATR
jgi:hypothetical protein